MSYINKHCVSRTVIAYYLKKVGFKSIVFVLSLVLMSCGGGSRSGATDTEDPEAQMDTDNDGIVNSADSCLNTPSELIGAVDAQGCHRLEITDTDADRIFDVADACKNTPSALTTNIDGTGCHISEITDSDNDGIFDASDQCLATPSGLTSDVDAAGCHLSEITDTDNDGIFDVSDQCLATPPDLASDVDAAGCHVSEITDPDGDGDGIADASDQCPATPEEFIAFIDDTGCDSGQFKHYMLAINAGDAEVISSAGITFLKDAYFAGGGTRFTRRAIAGTVDDVLFHSERSGRFNYKIPLTPGEYKLEFYFAERTNPNARARPMDITVEGEPVLSGLDIFAAVGANTAHVVSTDTITLSDNVLNIRFSAENDKSKVAAIAVTQTLNRDDDEDSDGVNNYDDQCVYTATAFVGNVAENGCAPEELDDDNDKIINVNDVCLGTPSGELTNDEGCSATQTDNDNDLVVDADDLCDHTDPLEVAEINAQGCSPNDVTRLSMPFVEQNGLLVIELESTNYADGWVVESGRLSTGNQYIIWTGDDYFGQPGNGEFTIDIQITNPGTYRFLWRSVIGRGLVTSEHNDSWLKIIADNFYGRKGNTGHIVCPRRQEASNRCVGDDPHGSSNRGWFKVYRSGGPAAQWIWATATSDNDGHGIYADFDTAGTYQIRISGRSSLHGIDRLVMYRDRNAENNISFGNAIRLSHPESLR